MKAFPTEFKALNFAWKTQWILRSQLEAWHLAGNQMEFNCEHYSTPFTQKTLNWAGSVGIHGKYVPNKMLYACQMLWSTEESPTIPTANIPKVNSLNFIVAPISHYTIPSIGLRLNWHAFRCMFNLVFCAACVCVTSFLCALLCGCQDLPNQNEI